MYWTALAIFLFMILVPELVQDGLFLFTESQLEMMAIFSLGVVSFLIFLARHNQSLRLLQERMEMQREVNASARDLSLSYSYIGETNRKLDLLKNLFITLPEDLHTSALSEKEFFDHICATIAVLVKTDRFSIRFIDCASLRTRGEIAHGAPFTMSLSNKALCDAKMGELSSDKDRIAYKVIPSEKRLRNTIATLIIPSSALTYDAEDQELLKALASYILFFFMLTKKQNHKMLSNT